MSDRKALIQSKLKAFAIHLCGSAVVIALYLAMVFLVWYPYPYYSIEKVWDVIRVVVSVDVFIGPLLTLVVYRVGKASLRFDMTVIIIVQLAALFWGLSVTYSQRPVFAALVSDNYIVSIVAASEVDINRIGSPELEVSPWSKPRLVYVDLPYTDQEYSRIGKENLAAGRRFAQYAQFYRPVDQFRQVVVDHAIDIDSRMKQFPQLKQAIETLLGRHGGKIDDYIFISVEGRVAIGLLMIRQDNLQVVDALLD